MELSCDNDLFFLLYHAMDITQFEELKAIHGMSIEFHAYAAMVVEVLNQCIDKIEEYEARLCFLSNDQISFEVSHDVDFRRIGLFSLELMRANETLVSRHVVYRHDLATQQVTDLAQSYPLSSILFNERILSYIMNSVQRGSSKNVFIQFELDSH